MPSIPMAHIRSLATNWFTPNSAVFIASLRMRPLTLCYGGERIARVLKRPVGTKVIALAQRPCNGLS